MWVTFRCRVRCLFFRRSQRTVGCEGRSPETDTGKHVSTRSGVDVAGDSVWYGKSTRGRMFFERIQMAIHHDLELEQLHGEIHIVS